MMKKLNFLLLVMSLMLQPVVASSNSETQKIDLSPKIKKGDTWKTIIDAGSLDFKWQGNDYSNSKNLIFEISMGMKNSTTKFEWNTSCLESTKEKLIIQFILERYVEESNLDSDNLNYLVYNDTDYPLTLTHEDADIIKTILGKMIILEIPWNSDSVVKTKRNDFEEDNIYFPSITFQNHNTPQNMNTRISMNSYAGLATGISSLLMSQWKSALPKSKVNIGAKWQAKLEVGEETVNLNYELDSLTARNVFVKVKSENDGNGKMVINRRNGWPSFLDENATLNMFSYNMSEPNTNVRGDFNDNLLNGTAYFEIDYPIGHKAQSIKVTRGKFEFKLDLKEGVAGKIKFDGTDWDVFLSPGMDVDIHWNDNDFVASGFGSEDINCIGQLDLGSYISDYTTNTYSKEEIVIMKKRYETKVDSILSGFIHSISFGCRNYIRTEAYYRMASWFNRALDRIELEKTTKLEYLMPDDINRLLENEEYLQKHLDTLQINGLYSLASRSYHHFIRDNLELVQKSFLEQRGRRYSSDKFDENILFAGIQYVGYPFFYAVYSILKSEIIKGNEDFIQKELNDFYNSACSSTLKNDLKKEIAEMRPLKGGSLFPFTEITDIDGVIRKLPKGELCIVDLKEWISAKSPQHIDELEELTKIITEDERINRINYVVIRPDYAKGKMVETTSNETVKFVYIYLPEKDLTAFESLKIINRSRVFLLDENLKIIHNNIGEIGYYTGHKLREILDKYFQVKNQTSSKAGTSRLLLVILVSVIGFGLLSWFVIRVRTKQIQKKEDARRKLSELELKAIRSQMNPHFIFNAMGSIQNLINQNKAKNANLYLSRFARLMRMVLANSNKKLVSLSDELELIKHYLELEQLRVDFIFTISLEENIDPETEEIPGMLIQPFVENAVIHGITPKGKGNVWVRFSKNEDTLTCEIIDDGVGIKTSKAGNGSGIAMKLAAKRLDLLNSQLQTQLRLTVENRMEKENTEGTKITLLIPIG